MEGTKMKRKSPGIVAALLVCASSLALAQTSMSPDEAKKKIEAAGYTMVENIKPAGNGYTAVAMKGSKMLPVRVDKDGKVEEVK
jgi:hypothetical protein